MNFNATKLRALVDEQISKDKNATSKQINNAQIASNEAIKLAERIQNAEKMKDERAKVQIQKDIDMFKLKLDAQYKKGQLTMQQLNFIKDLFFGDRTGASKVLQSLTGATGDVADILGG